MCEKHDFWRIDFELYHNGCDQSLLVLPTPALVANRSLTNSTLLTTHASMTDDQTTFIVSPNSTPHAGISEDSAECGSTHTGTWSTLEAPDLEMAVMEHNTRPVLTAFQSRPILSNGGGMPTPTSTSIHMRKRQIFQIGGTNG